MAFLFRPQPLLTPYSLPDLSVSAFAPATVASGRPWAQTRIRPQYKPQAKDIGVSAQHRKGTDSRVLESETEYRHQAFPTGVFNRGGTHQQAKTGNYPDRTGAVKGHGHAPGARSADEHLGDQHHNPVATPRPRSGPVTHGSLKGRVPGAAGVGSKRRKRDPIFEIQSGVTGGTGREGPSG